MKIALLSGASSGIGEAYIRHLAKDPSVFRGVIPDEVWLLARRGDKLNRLAEEFPTLHIRPFAIDLSAKEGADALAQALSTVNPTIIFLMNCAGTGKYGEFTEGTREDTRGTLLLNCAALSDLLHICLPYMLTYAKEQDFAQGPRIVNIASSAAFLPQPGFSVYAASKAYVVSLSRALSAELKPLGIGVTAVCPGPVATDFIANASGSAAAKPRGIKALFLVKADDLVRRSIPAIRRGRSMYIHTFSQKMLYLSSKLIPTGWMIKLIRSASK